MDSRIQQITAALDDARTTCADMLEDPPLELEASLRRVRAWCNAAIEELNQSSTCALPSLGGSVCVRPGGHGGYHQNRCGHFFSDSKDWARP